MQFCSIMMKLIKWSLFFIYCLICFSVSTQNPVAIGQWKSYLPYSGAISVADADDAVYVANGTAVYSYGKTDQAFTLYNKATGLSEADAMKVFYGKEQKTLSIFYLNSNIDFIINNEMFNFPFIKTGNITGDKSLNDAFYYGDTIYISTGFGIVLFDVSKKESPATYNFLSETSSYFSVNASGIFHDSIFAATDAGIYAGAIEGSNLQDFGQWELLDSPAGACKDLAIADAHVFAVFSDTALYAYNGEDWSLVYSSSFTIDDITASSDEIIASLHEGDFNDPAAFQIFEINYESGVGDIVIINSPENIHAPRQAMKDEQNVLWIADPYKGLVKYSDGIFSNYIPNGPQSSLVFDMEFNNHDLWVAPGEISGSWGYLYNRDGFFQMNYGYWNNHNLYNTPNLDSVLDIITLTVSKQDGLIYLGSYGDGVLQYQPATNELTIFDATNSSLQDVPGDAGSCRIAGLAIDDEQNLWVSNYGAPEQLSVKDALGNWTSFDCGLPTASGNQTAQIAIDDFNQKWVQLARGNGILVYNHGATVSDVSDDEHRTLGIGVGNGNLPVSYVNCLVKDKDGEIWVGTNEGITIFYNPGEIFSGTASGDASQPLVNLGGYNEYLLSKEIINCIAVDGANRKWVGTNSGVFLINEDGTEQLLFFSPENSPLLSSIVLSITIDGESGEIFFGTSKGIVSYRYTATDGAEEHQDVTVYPNPVRENYTGLIAIKGLVDNAQVKITDASGRLIYETTALGGQAIWDGKGYEGKRAQTGIYLVYSSNDDGTETYVTKFLIVN